MGFLNISLNACVCIYIYIYVCVCVCVGTGIFLCSYKDRPDDMDVCTWV